MKKALLLFMSCAVYGLQAQVGVNTTDPKKTLDVNGEIRVQKTVEIPSIGENKNCPCFLVVDEKGVVKRISIKDWAGSLPGSGSGSGSGGTSGGGGTTVVGGGAPATEGGVTNKEVFDPVVYDIRWNLYKTMDVKIKLPLNLPSGVPYSAYMSPEVTLPMVDGTTRNFRLTYPQGTTNGEPIEATLLISGDRKYVPKLILEGNPAENYDLDLFFNGVEQDAKLTLRIEANAVQNTEHGKVFTYPVIKIGDQGLFALALGAKYAEEATNTPEVLKDWMYMESRAERRKAYKMYGSTFQWQRKADEHELVDWTLSSSGTTAQGTPVHGVTNVQSNSWTNAGTNEFIFKDHNYSWVTSSVANAGPHDLWQEGGSNNPCPTGYSLPTYQKIRDFVAKYNEAYKGRVEYVGRGGEPRLWYPYGASRYAGGVLVSPGEGSQGFWTSDKRTNNNQQALYFSIRFNNNNESYDHTPYEIGNAGNVTQAYGYSIVCTKN